MDGSGLQRTYAFAQPAAAALYDFGLGHGVNFLTIMGTDGQRIDRVDINSNTGVNMVNINDGRQFRIDDIQDPPAELPEPDVVWLLGTGLAGIAVTAPAQDGIAVGSRYGRLLQCSLRQRFHHRQLQCDAVLCKPLRFRTF